jgi:hypothetical protein
MTVKDDILPLFGLLANGLRSFEGACGLREGGRDLGGVGGGGLGGEEAGLAAVLCECKFEFGYAASHD